LFDLDGTLTDPKLGITSSVQYALGKMGITVADLDELLPFIGPPLAESFQEFYGLSTKEAKQAVEYYREYFAIKGMYENAVYPGIMELLSDLTKRNKKIVMATSKPTVYSEQIAKHFGFFEFFTYIAGSNLDGTRVDKAEVIAFALDLICCTDKQKIVMVGDRRHDIIGAQKNKLDVIGVEYGYGGRIELLAAKPTYIAATVNELAQIVLA
jgi:phosphoglycolate phosphatase